MDGAELRLGIWFRRGDWVWRRIGVGIRAGKGRDRWVESRHGATLKQRCGSENRAEYGSHDGFLDFCFLWMRVGEPAASCLRLPNLADEQSFQPLAPVHECQTGCTQRSRMIGQ